MPPIFLLNYSYLTFFFSKFIRMGYKFVRKKSKLENDDNTGRVAGTGFGSKYRGPVVVPLNQLYARIKKTTCPLDSFDLEKKLVMYVFSVARSWQTKLWFQVS